MTLPNTSITVAQMVPAGGFTLPGAGPAAVQLFSRLPAFCRVAATLTPSADSDIKMEVWLPAASWHGKFQAVGNGGWAATLSYGALASGSAVDDEQYSCGNRNPLPQNTASGPSPSARSWEAIGTIPCRRVARPPSPRSGLT